ncbi:hypothetical protein GCM10009863_10260 [Streptomyces axinellae]|uniref:Uncharacterized protein n=1 Tax=Streptomyces axinellae TaxID=552788 RepID=A0ABN3PRB0_9ACTN
MQARGAALCGVTGADTEFLRDVVTDERRSTLIAATPVGRPGDPDGAGAVAFPVPGGTRHHRAGAQRHGYSTSTALHTARVEAGGGAGPSSRTRRDGMWPGGAWFW